MSDSGYVVAVYGAATGIGREVQAVLREREFPVSEWRLFDVWERFGDVGEADLEAPLMGPDRIDFDGADVVFMCVTEALSAEWSPRAVDAGAVVVDLTQAFAEHVDVPLVVPEVNPEAIVEGVARGILASPVPGATALAVVLRPLDEMSRLKRVVVACYESAASAGQEAVEELAQQMRDLLSGRSPEAVVFPHRMAFNLIPQVGEFLLAGRTRGEWQIESQVRRILDLPDLPMSVTSVRVPTFYGQGYAVNVETEIPVEAVRARSTLREAPGVVLTDDDVTPSYPTLVETLGSDATQVGRVRDDPTVPYGLNLWVAIDGMRKGSVTNAVQIAELIVRDYR